MLRAVKTNLILIIFISISTSPLFSRDYTPAYIEQYKTIVINEMQRTGIPASIKMAQAILESASGRSTLARQSNNHFGIKCGKEWKGPEVYRHDDDYKDGLLVRSCFRAYDDPRDSFIAHSNFLSNPHSKRYGFLFDLDPFDYEAWAHGLKKAGYATDPNYPSKLIHLIEKYELYLLDLGVTQGREEEIFVHASPQNDQSSTRAEQQKTPETVSRQIVTTRRSPDYILKNGSYTFQLGDQMDEIAKRFKMDVKELYFKNRLPYGVTPRSGQKLSVRSYIHLKRKPAYIDTDKMTPEKFLFEEDLIISSL